MSKTMRSLLLVICAVQLLFAVAFFFQWPLAVNVWPFEGTTPLTYIFIASIFAAAAASTLWPIFTGNYGALAGVGLDYAVILAPMSAYILWLGLAGGDSGKIIYGVICALGAAFGAWLFWWSRRLPMPDEPIPMPPLVRWSFVVFVVALLYTSGRLLLNIPTIPWPLTPELAVIVACIFLGAAAYFIYALLRPSWANAGGQLSGFLAYDLVLLVPFLTRLPDVAPEFRTGLIVYTVVVVYSALLAVYYLFINRQTRLFGAAATAAGVSKA
jgi:hypothetical protein